GGVRGVARAVHEGLHRRAGPDTTDDRVLPDGHARRSGGLDARPRRRQLREDLTSLYRRAPIRPSHPGSHPRQHHSVLAHRLRGPGAPAARMAWESGRSAAAAAGQPPPEVSLPVAFTVFPGEIFQAPRSWAEKVYPNLIYFHKADRGGHFAAWEEPQLFSEEL